jgi:hypothetical protein
MLNPHPAPLAPDEAAALGRIDFAFVSALFVGPKKDYGYASWKSKRAGYFRLQSIDRKTFARDICEPLESHPISDL